MSRQKKRKTLNNFLFPGLYTILACGLYLLAFFWLILFSFKKKYRHSIPARFFLFNNPPFSDGHIWFHACSFGETRALKPIINALSGEKIAISTTTKTGFDEARKISDTVRFLPFEPLLWFWITRQKVLVVMEAELWYLLFFVAKRRGAKTMLINARISDRSYKGYLRFRWFYKKIFDNIDEVYAQSDIDKIRLQELGAKNIEVTGNIKLAEPAVSLENYPKPKGIVVTAASTHEGEEEGIIDAFISWKQDHENARLIIVPRHPERFLSVAAIAVKKAKNAGLSFSKWSEEQNLEYDIVEVDAMGELINFYALSDIVILGGAFAPVGGHNPAEVIPFGCRLISGKKIFNQKAMFDAVEGALFCDMDDLPDTLTLALKTKPLTLKVKASIDSIVSGIKAGCMKSEFEEKIL